MIFYIYKKKIYIVFWKDEINRATAEVEEYYDAANSSTTANRVRKIQRNVSKSSIRSTRRQTYSRKSSTGNIRRSVQFQRDDSGISETQENR